VAEEVLTLMRTIRTFGTEEQEFNRYQKSLERITAIGARSCTAYALYLVSSSFLFNATKVFRQSSLSLRKLEQGD